MKYYNITVNGVAGHISGTGGNGVGSAAHLSGVLGSLGVGGGNDVVGSVDLGLVQDRDGSVGLQSADGAAVDGDLQIGVGQSGVDRAHSLAGQQSHLGGAADMTCDAANARASVVAAFELLTVQPLTAIFRSALARAV